MVYLVSYDLNKSGQNYDGLYSAIKELGSYCHCLDSSWLVETNLNSGQISTFLRQRIDDNDNILIIRVMKDYQGWLPKEFWDWLDGANFS